MRRTTWAVLAIALTSASAIAADNAAEVESSDAIHSRWKGVIACVDRSFYDGGYEEGNAKREALMNSFLSLQKLPAYNEDRLKLEIKDRDAYMAGYESCEARWAELEALAKKHGVGVPGD
jgi:hypothetical protein